MFIETETTPNPATLKFLPGQEVMSAGTRDFRDEDDAAASPLAEALFSLGDVTGVFFGSNFVSVTAGPGSDWSALKPQVVAILLDHFVSQIPLFHAPSAGWKPGFARPWPTMGAISPIAASAKGWSIFQCRAPVRAAHLPRQRSSRGSKGC